MDRNRREGGMSMIYMNQYQRKAVETAIFPKENALAYLALGLAGEAGEVANKIKKVIRDDAPTDGIAAVMFYGTSLYWLITSQKT